MVKKFAIAVTVCALLMALISPVVRAESFEKKPLEINLWHELYILDCYTRDLNNDTWDRTRHMNFIEDEEDYANPVTYYATATNRIYVKIKANIAPYTRIIKDEMDSLEAEHAAIPADLQAGYEFAKIHNDIDEMPYVGNYDQAKYEAKVAEYPAVRAAFMKMVETKYPYIIDDYFVPEKPQKEKDSGGGMMERPTPTMASIIKPDYSHYGDSDSGGIEHY
ncbi:MAG: hypothetical protein LBN08_01590 [Lactobacillales bacterium]|jgi:hypothetical protein|nr:hypothetical protein [Lactobacillales bacterium]